MLSLTTRTAFGLANYYLSQPLIDTLALTATSILAQKVQIFMQSSIPALTVVHPAQKVTPAPTPFTGMHPDCKETWPELAQFIANHHDELLALIKGKSFDGSQWESISGGSTKFVYSHRKFPTFIFKMLYHSDSEAASILQKTVDYYDKVRTLCDVKKLDKIKIPKAHLLTKINEAKVALLVEERIPITYQGSVQKIVEMNKDPEKQMLLNELIRQKGILVYHLKLEDVKENNIGVLEHGNEIGIVDVDSISPSFNPSIYGVMIKHLFASNIATLRKTLEIEDPEFFHKFDFDAVEIPRLIQAEKEEDFEKFKEKYLDITDPLVLPTSIVEKLRSDQRVVAEHLLSFLNAKLKEKKFYDLSRVIPYYDGINLAEETLMQFRMKWQELSENQGKKWDYQNYRDVEDQILDLFIREKIIHSYVVDYGYKYIYC